MNSIWQQDDITQRALRIEGPATPDGFDFTSIKGLKKEGQQKFTKIELKTIGQAARIRGITPADISLLSVWIEKRLGESKDSAG